MPAKHKTGSLLRAILLFQSFSAIAYAAKLDWVYKGCYADLQLFGSTDVLQQPIAYSPDNCQRLCQPRYKDTYGDYFFAGIKDGYECHCGYLMHDLDSKLQRDERECNMPCEGSSANCGGMGKMNVYAARSKPKSTNTTGVSYITVTKTVTADPQVITSTVTRQVNFTVTNQAISTVTKTVYPSNCTEQVTNTISKPHWAFTPTRERPTTLETVPILTARAPAAISAVDKLKVESAVSAVDRVAAARASAAAARVSVIAADRMTVHRPHRPDLIERKVAPTHRKGCSGSSGVCSGLN